jgi:hypothetical protein
MLFANWFADQIGKGFGYTVIFLAVVIMCARKFGEANPEVKDAAKKAAASKAIQLIGRFFK